MVKPHGRQGILKNPTHGPGRPTRQFSISASSEDLLPTTTTNAEASGSISNVPSSESITSFEKEKQDRHDDDDDDDDMVEVSIQGESDHEPEHEHRRRQRPPAKVQFPDDLNKGPPLPYNYTRQDSDTFSSPPSIAGTDDEDSEDYDWSDEDDLVDQEAKFGKQMGKKTTRKGWGIKRVISLLFSSLIGSTLLAAILVTPGILIHFYWYKPNPTEHRKYVKDNVQAWLFWAAANLLISWYLAMIIDIVPILFRYLISAVWGHVSESIKTRIEVYDSVKDTTKPAFYAGSAYASWTIIFVDIFSLYNAGHPAASRASYTIRTAEVVQFWFFLILVWCAQRMLSHFIAFSFHRTAYKERVDAVEKALVVIEKLRQYRPKHSSTPRKSGARTPVLGSLGLSSTLTDKQHSRLLRGALKKASPFRTSHGEDRDHDHDEDMDVADKTLVDPWNQRRKTSTSNRPSWFGDAEGSQSRNVHDRGSRDGHELGKVRVAVEKEGVEADIEMSPASPVIGQVYTATPATPSHLNPNRYPPADSPRPSVDGTDSPTLKQAAKLLKNAILHDARNLSGRNENDGLSWNVNSAHEAKRLARSIWTRFRDSHRTWLVPSDFYPAFPDHESAEDAFKVLDSDNNGDLSRAEIKTVLLKVYKERRFLSRSMRDVGEALKTLDRILLFFAGVILFFIALSVFGVNVANSLTSVYTVGIAASFIFKNAASSAFDAIMLLFVTHPYDTGDRVMIGQENLIVKKVGLFATVFARSDGSETYYFNSQLFTQFILNVRRSGKTFENLTMQVAWTTPLTKLDALEKCLNDWLSTEEHRWFEPSTNITLQNIEFQRYLELTIGIGHNGNWQDWGLRNARKTAFHAATQYYCRQLGIVGYEAPLPIVYANSSTLTYQPSLSPVPPEEALSPFPASPNKLKEEAVEAEKEAKDMKPTLGFLPPLAVRASHLRARKSRNRRANIGAGNA